MKFVLNTIYTLLITVTVVLALLFVGSHFPVFGYQVKIVQSGSMEPAIDTGSIILIAPASSYDIGDVVTFGEDTATKIPTTHRIVDINTSPLGRSLYTTKGDANEEHDPTPIRLSDIIGKVWLSVPYIGYVLEFARTPLGYGLLIGIPAAFIVLDEFANIVWEFRKYLYRRRKGRVGYRTPARNRQPRDQKPSTPDLEPLTIRIPVRSTPVQRTTMRPSERKYI